MAACGAVWVSTVRPAVVSERIACRPLPLEAAPASTDTSLGGRTAVALSTTSATMQVMLSGPPPWIARSISWRTASSGSATVASVRCRTGSLTTPDRPSEHSR